MSWNGANTKKGQELRFLALGLFNRSRIINMDCFKKSWLYGGGGCVVSLERALLGGSERCSFLINLKQLLQSSGTRQFTSCSTDVSV